MFGKSDAVLQTPADPAAAAGGGALVNGGFWIRFLAYLADTSIIFLALLVLAVPGAVLGAAGVTIYGAVCMLGPDLYFALMQASARQATFGKELLGLKVAHAGTGDRISVLRSLGRELAKIISAIPLGIGFLLAAFTSRKQALHDFIASTVIVREKSARIVPAILVIVAGILIPVVALPLMLGAFMGSMLVGMMGGMISMRKAGNAITAAALSRANSSRA